jgi:hypothetical protein
MPLAGSGSGKETPSSEDNISKRLDRLEELVRSISGDLHDVKQQQQGLGVAVLRLEKNSSSAGDGTPTDGNTAATVRPPHHHRPHGMASESDAVDDHLPASIHKIEFPKFDGTSDPMAWLNRYECYFTLRGTPEHQHVQYASFYQPWYHRLELNGGPPSWPHFWCTSD